MDPSDTSDPALGTARATDSERRSAPPDERYRFGGVLLLQLVLFVFISCDASGPWVQPVTVALEGAALLGALITSHSSRLVLKSAYAIVGTALAVSIVTAGLAPSRYAAGGLLSALVCLAIPLVVVRALLRRGVVDLKTIFGALSIYVSLGLAFALFDAAVQVVTARPFFAQPGNESPASFLYFSFVTLTTVGYGDLTATAGFGRALAAIEAMAGQLYLVTVVATLVSNLRPRIGAKPD